MQRSPRLVRVWHHAAGIVGMDVAVTPGLVATGSTDGILMVRAFPSGDPVTEIRERSSVTGLALSSNGQVLAAGYADGHVGSSTPPTGSGCGSSINPKVSPTLPSPPTASSPQSLRVKRSRSGT